MKRYTFICTAILTVAFAASNDAMARGFSRGGGGRSFAGGARSMGGGFSSAARAAPRAMSVSRAMSAPRAMSASRSSMASQRMAGVGPHGGSFQAGRGGGSFTTQRGATVDYGGRGGSRTGLGGVTRGGGLGGVKVTGAGGQEFSKVGRVGGARGPAGNSIGGGRSASHTSGPLGSGSSLSRGGFASGPNAMAAFRGGVSVGPRGVVAGRTGVAANGHGTYFRSATAVRGQGLAVRAGAVGYHNCFSQTWCARYPSAWYPGRWAAATAWTVATWDALSSYGGYPVDSVNYDYGSSVVYQDNSVYVNGDDVGTAEEYSQQAAALAETGKAAAAPVAATADATADAPADDADQWKPLGVFAMVQGEEKSSNNIFQLAINKDSVIRGNYYNAVTDTTEPVYGSVDKKTQRVAWLVGDTKAPVYEAGLVNLTKDETTMMIHYSKDRSKQASLFRIKQDEGDAATK